MTMACPSVDCDRPRASRGLCTVEHRHDLPATSPISMPAGSDADAHPRGPAPCSFRPQRNTDSTGWIPHERMTQAAGPDDVQTSLHQFAQACHVRGHRGLSQAEGRGEINHAALATGNLMHDRKLCWVAKATEQRHRGRQVEGAVVIVQIRWHRHGAMIPGRAARRGIPVGRARNTGAMLGTAPC